VGVVWMKSSGETNPFLGRPNYEIFLFLLTLLSVLNIFLLLFLNPLSQQVILIIDNVICLVFLLDFLVRLIRIRPPRTYLVNWYGWMDFFGSLPLPGFRLIRLARYILIGRKMRRSDFRLVGQRTIRLRAQSTLLGVILVAIIILEISGIMILRLESTATNANILTASDALWWNLVTVATVGYGDRFPVTNSGRILAIFVMTVGVGLFSVFTSFLADWFRRVRDDNQNNSNILAQETLKEKPDIYSAGKTDTQADLGSQMKEIEQLIEELELDHQEAINQIKNRIKKIENEIS
jgi:voltage-gated potassium channel